MEQNFSVELNLEGGYAFSVDFHHPFAPDLLVDEPSPLGEGRGPNAVRLLAAAVGNCMSASLVHCLRRARLHVASLHTRVEGTVVRNEGGRLRVGELKVILEPGVPIEERDRMQRCLDLFEDFCIVAQSIRQGIDVNVSVLAPKDDDASEAMLQLASRMT